MASDAVLLVNQGLDRVSSLPGKMPGHVPQHIRPQRAGSSHAATARAQFRQDSVGLIVGALYAPGFMAIHGVWGCAVLLGTIGVAGG